MGKVLIIIGIFIMIIGMLLLFKVPILFGKLPGDIAVKSKHIQFYFPIMSSMIISLILSILFYLFGKY